MMMESLIKKSPAGSEIITSNKLLLECFLRTEMCFRGIKR